MRGSASISGFARLPRSTVAPSLFIHTSTFYRNVDDDDEPPKREQPKYQYKYSSSGKGAEKKQGAQFTDEETTAMTKFGHSFDTLPPDQRNKENFQNAVGVFLQRNVHRRGQVEFIYAALKHMREFGVLRDLDCYKALLNIFPKGKMIAENKYQLALKHYPKHQDCCIAVLDQMQYYFCYPDKETYNIVENAFGDWSFAMLKMRRMMYWMPKFRYINPYRAPDPLPRDSLELAKLAIKRMCRDPSNETHVWYTEAMENPPEKTWIVCGQSCHQRDHISEHPVTKPFYVDGPFREWIVDQNLSYFVLLADARADKWYGDIDSSEPETADEWANWTTKFNSEFPESRKALMKMPTIHEQPEGTILSIAVTGSSTKDSLICWIQFLQRMNPKLEKIPVVFRLAHGIKDLVVRKKAEKAEKERLIESS